MAQYEVKIDEQDVASLLFKDEGLKKLVEAILNQILEAQMTEHVGAETYERSQNRKAYRNGHRVRKLYTRVGPLNLLVPQARDGRFSTSLFKRYQRSEQAFVLALMEMYLNGVSTRKVTKITEELCGVSFSKSTVSDLCLELDSRVDAWNNRVLFEKKYPFVIVDALVIKVRKELGIVPISTLITIGITTEGYREILGIHLGDSESESTWQETFEQLKFRGLKGVDYVISDSHFGLVKALKRNFQGVCWQRCQVHFQRNVLSATPRKHREGIVQILKKILKADNQGEARKIFTELSDIIQQKSAKATDILERGLEDAITVLKLPDKYRKRLRTTNMIERLNEEIRRREKVIRIFPNEESARRLIGALLVEKHEKWITDQKYFNMDEYLQWRKIEKNKQPQKVTFLRK